MLRYMLGVVLALLVACATPPPHVTVAIDGAFTTSQTAALGDALADWRDKTGLAFDYDLTTFPSVNQRPANTLVVLRDDGIATSGECGHTDGSASNGTIRITTTDYGCLLNRSFRHELGHAFGLGHYIGPEASVMHPDITDDSDTVQPRDIAEYKLANPE